VAALNAGIAAANGAFIARMDGDDISSPDRFEIQHAFLIENPDVVLVGGATAGLQFAIRIVCARMKRSSRETVFSRSIVDRKRTLGPPMIETPVFPGKNLKVYSESKQGATKNRLSSILLGQESSGHPGTCRAGTPKPRWSPPLPPFE
jgi:glycosyltransferase involved in cell wall biosynthesis